MENTDKCDCVQDQHKYCICSWGSKVEFARKLGYNEKLLQEALIRRGPNSTPNELLSELIQLRDQYKNLSDSEFDLIDTESNKSFTIFLPVSCINKESNGLRAIVIDGSNVAISHGNKEIFSCRGIKICVDWFKNRGHKYITVFVPKWRKESFSTDNPIKDPEILQELERERLLVFTPSRFIGGKRMICYDDRYILKLAAETNGIVVSNDNYRDLVQESFEFKKVVEERLLMFSFVNDIFMPPDDPLGRSGPKLNYFLCMQNPVADSTSLCPYGKKCTYGSKCKFYHPKRCPGTNKTVTDRISVLAEHQSISKNVVRASLPVGKSHSMPLSLSEDCRTKEIVYRTKSSSSEGFSNSSVQTQSQLVHAVTSFSSCSLQEKETKELRLNEELFQPILSNPKTHSQINRIKSLTELSVTKIDDQANHHKKLQRKLYLNPPQQDISINPLVLMTEHNISGNPLHKHLMGSFTDSCTSNLNSSRYYEDVTQISSSPISSLDNLNETTFLWSDQPICSLSNHTISNSLHLIDTRRKLFYHLASIFPAEYVTQVMDQYPTETEPHKICAGILKMFPKT